MSLENAIEIHLRIRGIVLCYAGCSLLLKVPSKGYVPSKILIDADLLQCCYINSKEENLGLLRCDLSLNAIGLVINFCFLPLKSSRKMNSLYTVQH